MVLAELDPEHVGDVTLAMLKANWPPDWKAASAVVMHADAVAPEDGWRESKAEGLFGGRKGGVGTPRGMSYAQQAVARGKKFEDTVAQNTFNYGEPPSRTRASLRTSSIRTRGVSGP